MSEHVLIAPDKFKGSLTATEVADAVARGVRRARPDVVTRCTPVADGGDGTVEVALAAGFRRHDVPVTGPAGESRTAPIAVSGDLAVVELAVASGIALLPQGELAPMTAGSTGTGELVRAALDAGCRRIVVGVGGSAGTDGGAGMVTALGARLLASTGESAPTGGVGLAGVASLDLSGLDRRLASAELTLASDVDNPLLGPRGAARIYGPQKGSTPDQVEELERAMRQWSEVVAASTGSRWEDEPGAGAAGGVGFAALAVLGARRRSGTGVVLDLVGFREQLHEACLVVTGEGALDEQTLHGKAPAGVAESAAGAAVPVVAVAGACALDADRLRDSGFAAAYTLTEREQDLRRCLRDGAKLLEDVGADLAAEWLGGACPDNRV